jgi:hypothetical protein
MNVSIGVVLLAGFVLASLPMMGERGFFSIPVFKTNKKPWLRMVEFLLAYAVWIAIGKVFEAQAGQVAKQGWEFYAVTFLLFVIAAFPAFAWRYLWRRA